MGYVIAVVVLLLIVALGVTLLRVSARRHGRAGSQAAADETHGAGVPGSDMAIVAEDRSSPLGDTSEHSGRQQEGETVSDQDADRSGGSGRPAAATPERAASAHRRRVGGPMTRTLPGPSWAVKARVCGGLPRTTRTHSRRSTSAKRWTRSASSSPGTARRSTTRPPARATSMPTG